jgi:hypothetical protein
VRRVRGALDLDEGAVGRECGAPPGPGRGRQSVAHPLTTRTGTSTAGSRRSGSSESVAAVVASMRRGPINRLEGALAAPAWLRSRARWHDGPSRGTPDRPSGRSGRVGPNVAAGVPARKRVSRTSPRSRSWPAGMVTRWLLAANTTRTVVGDGDGARRWLGAVLVYCAAGKTVGTYTLTGTQTASGVVANARRDLDGVTRL